MVLQRSRYYTPSYRSRTIQPGNNDYRKNHSMLRGSTPLRAFLHSSFLIRSIASISMIQCLLKGTFNQATNICASPAIRLCATTSSIRKMCQIEYERDLTVITLWLSPKASDKITNQVPFTICVTCSNRSSRSFMSSSIPSLYVVSFLRKKNLNLPYSSLNILYSSVFYHLFDQPGSLVNR